MKILIRLLLCCLIFDSCVRIPSQSVTLLDAVMNESDRMHQLNVTLLNKIFTQKSQQIDAFITTEYTPKYLDMFIKRIPQGTDVQAELPNIIKAVTHKINGRRDSMQSTLEEQRLKLVTQLNTDYAVLSNGTLELKNQLATAAKIDKNKVSMYTQVKSLSKGKLDIGQIENSLDGFINTSGNITGNINTGITNLNNSINSILKN